MKTSKEMTKEINIESFRRNAKELYQTAELQKERVRVLEGEIQDCKNQLQALEDKKFEKEKDRDELENSFNQQKQLMIKLSVAKDASSKINDQIEELRRSLIEPVEALLGDLKSEIERKNQLLNEKIKEHELSKKIDDELKNKINKIIGILKKSQSTPSTETPISISQSPEPIFSSIILLSNSSSSKPTESLPVSILTIENENLAFDQDKPKTSRKRKHKPESSQQFLDSVNEIYSEGWKKWESTKGKNPREYEAAFGSFNKAANLLKEKLSLLIAQGFSSVRESSRSPDKRGDSNSINLIRQNYISLLTVQLSILSEVMNHQRVSKSNINLSQEMDDIYSDIIKELRLQLEEFINETPKQSSDYAKSMKTLMKIGEGMRFGEVLSSCQYYRAEYYQQKVSLLLMDDELQILNKKGKIDSDNAAKKLGELFPKFREANQKLKPISDNIIDCLECVREVLHDEKNGEYAKHYYKSILEIAACFYEVAGDYFFDKSTELENALKIDGTNAVFKSDFTESLNLAIHYYDFILLKLKDELIAIDAIDNKKIAAIENSKRECVVAIPQVCSFASTVASHFQPSPVSTPTSNAIAELFISLDQAMSFSSPPLFTPLKSCLKNGSNNGTNGINRTPKRRVSISPDDKIRTISPRPTEDQMKSKTRPKQ